MFTKRLLSATAAAVALIAAPAALAGPGMHVGVVEDAPIWKDPGTQMELARQGGFDRIRMTAQWSSGQTSLSSAVAQRMRLAEQAAVIRGIQPIISIYNANAASTPADPVSQYQFLQFVRSVVRAMPLVQTFIVGNEPNSNVYWMPQFDASGNDVAAAQYELLLAQSYDLIKQLRPTATVIGGALDPRGGDSPTSSKPSHSPTTFIADMGAAYRASARTTPLMDVWDEHIYADTSALPPSMPHTGSSTVAEADYTKLVSLLGKAFDGTAQSGSTLPIFYGEFGVETTIPASQSGAYTGTEQAATVDEATQAAYYTEAFKVALCQPNVIGIMIFHTIDEGPLSGWQSGPYYANGVPKSSLPAIKEAALGARAGSLTSCPDASAPTVTLTTPPLPTAPAASISLTAGADDGVGVGKVELLVDGAVKDVDFSAPYTFDWVPSHEGRTTLEVRAYDAAGNMGRSSTVTVSAAVAGGPRLGASGKGRLWRIALPPANDLFAAAQPIAGASGHVGGSTAFATLENGEPRKGGEGRTVWFRWHASAAGTERFAAAGQKVTVYSGSNVGILRKLGEGTDGVAVTGGTDYRIAVDGVGRSFTLAWRPSGQSPQAPHPHAAHAAPHH